MGTRCVVLLRKSGIIRWIIVDEYANKRQGWFFQMRFCIHENCSSINRKLWFTSIVVQASIMHAFRFSCNKVAGSIAFIAVNFFGK